MLFSLAACFDTSTRVVIMEKAANEEQYKEIEEEIKQQEDKKEEENQEEQSAVPEIKNNPTVQGMFYRNVIGADIEAFDEDLLEIDKKADAMLKKIEDYPDKVSVTGKTYYLSNEGNDKNDGLSISKSMKTYAALKGKLKSGDAVLFRRGDVFRGQIVLVSGVTYAAYGSGIKPRLYGSVDGTLGEWKETETDGVYTYNKVTKYANIIFNNGEAIGRPVQSMSQITKKPLNVYFSGARVSVYSPDGNPEEVFKSIEIVEDYSLCTGSGGTYNVKMQNLCMMYTGVHFLGSLGITENLEIEGCIMGYCGGRDLYQGAKATSLGNAVEFWSQAINVNIHDNYFFQAYDAALTHQGPSGTVKATGQTSTVNFTNIHYENNLLEYNTYDFEAFTCRSLSDQSKSPNGKFTYDDVYIKGNICRYTGWGWGSLDRPDKNVNTVFKYDAEGENDSNVHIKPLYIENNIFDRPRRSVLGISSPEWNKANMILKNNQFFVASNARIIDGITISGGYLTRINKCFTASGNTFKQVD